MVYINKYYWRTKFNQEVYDATHVTFGEFDVYELLPWTFLLNIVYVFCIIFYPDYVKKNRRLLC